LHFDKLPIEELCHGLLSARPFPSGVLLRRPRCSGNDSVERLRGSGLKTGGVPGEQPVCALKRELAHFFCCTQPPAALRNNHHKNIFIFIYL
jgi:hypothetical protein